MPKEVDEDLIEATIRRVAESKAARASEPAIEEPTNDDLIEATIRRVAESKAARASEPAIEMPTSDAVAPVFGTAPAPDPADDRVEIETPAESVPEQETPLAVEHAPTPMPRRQPRASGALAPEWIPTPEPAGDAISAQLRAINERLDAILPLLEKLVSGSAGEPHGEWDRRPASAPAMMSARPVKTRDSAPFSNSDVIDTRPLPEPLPPLVEPKRGFDLLPRTYRITIEDKRRGVDLVPLHRAMLGIEGVRDMSLLSYSNGTAIVALETQDELAPESVRLAMENAMKRDARVEVHNESTMVVKLTPED